ncbi:hypothetical protein ZIOFF_070777 [Zingiber officinale]|uniref:hAT-like transposase RNase-H fold domain-containing protein n=1 Tax=Zingiber officinale TaxID=94328 RepID=A0A8J5EU71_ZINOF|nr:hypothetical protein ZIOFF_070777 [Zingiber officinale]
MLKLSMTSSFQSFVRIVAETGAEPQRASTFLNPHLSADAASKVRIACKETLQKRSILYQPVGDSLTRRRQYLHDFLHSSNSFLSEEWKRGEKICEFLEPFYDTTNLISGSSYPTSNLYFMQVWKIEVLLKENLSNEDEVISSMCKRMMEKFDKYWTQYSMVLAFGAILDPRIKLSMLEFFYTKVESDYVKFQKKMELVKTKLYKLFDQYSNTSKTSSSQCQPQCSSTTNTHQESVGGVKGKTKESLM